VSDELNALLRDLAGYLEQQQQAGGLFYLEEEAPGEPEHDAPEPVAEAPAAPVADTTPEPAIPVVRTPSMRFMSLAASTPFEERCEAFVAEALELIARNGGRAAPSPGSGDLEALAAEVRSCTACALHQGRRNAVPGAGDPSASIMLVGEAPGQAEDQQGLPFVGPSGKLLTDILKAIGFSRDQVFIGNVLKCRPPGNRDPLPAEVQSCVPYLLRQIELIEPRVILCLGRIAAQTLLGTTASLRSLRQSVHFFAGVPLMVTYHPAALLRDPSHKRDTWDDVRLMRALHDMLGK
jgi:DNA polymerase